MLWLRRQTSQRRIWNILHVSMTCLLRHKLDLLAPSILWYDLLKWIEIHRRICQKRLRGRAPRKKSGCEEQKSCEFFVFFGSLSNWKAVGKSKGKWSMPVWEMGYLYCISSLKLHLVGWNDTRKEIGMDKKYGLVWLLDLVWREWE